MTPKARQSSRVTALSVAPLCQSISPVDVRRQVAIAETKPAGSVVETSERLQAIEAIVRSPPAARRVAPARPACR